MSSRPLPRLLAPVLVGALANQSRLSADDPSADRTLRPQGPEDQRLWADDSLVRLSGGGGGGGGSKDCPRKDGGGAADDRERKPDARECSGEPTGR